MYFSMRSDAGLIITSASQTRSRSTRVCAKSLATVPLPVPGGPRKQRLSAIWVGGFPCSSR